MTKNKNNLLKDTNAEQKRALKEWRILECVPSQTNVIFQITKLPNNFYQFSEPYIVLPAPDGFYQR